MLGGLVIIVAAKFRRFWIANPEVVVIGSACAAPGSVVVYLTPRITCLFTLLCGNLLDNQDPPVFCIEFTRLPDMKTHLS